MFKNARLEDVGMFFIIAIALVVILWIAAAVIKAKKMSQPEITSRAIVKGQSPASNGWQQVTVELENGERKTLLNQDRNNKLFENDEGIVSFRSNLMTGFKRTK